MKTAFSKLEVRTAEAEKKSENLEAQSRRDNLKFFGFQDDDKETWEQSEDKLWEYIRTELNINDSDIKIERAHRLLGKNSPRPIIVKFSFYKDKDNELQTYRQKRKDENNERNNDMTDSDAEMAPRIRVTEDFPERVTKARTKLFQHFLHGFSCFECIRKKKRTAGRGSGGVAVFIRDKLLQSGGLKRIYKHYTECVVLRFSAEAFQRNNDLVMFCTYIAPEDSPIYT